MNHRALLAAGIAFWRHVAPGHSIGPGYRPAVRFHTGSLDSTEIWRATWTGA